MALDLKAIAPADLVRLLNSTPLGEVISERQLYRHRQMAGLRIGDGKTLHLGRYMGFLAGRLKELDVAKKKQDPQTKAAEQYVKHKAQAAKRQAEIAEAGQEIGAIPEVVNPARRESCRLNFRLFCETYFKPIFYLSWSEDHLRAIAKIERAVLQGELFAFAMPRGSGKSALCQVAVTWAALYGHHRFICLIAATERMARRILEKIYNALERNDLLMEDFPEVCYPVKKLERTPQRAMKQKCDGRYTYMLWTKREIVLPTIQTGAADGHPVYTPSSGTIVSVCGLTGGEVRGQNKDMPGGGMLRPSLVLLDDPQTKGSAKSPTQCQDRLELLQGDVLGMAGPDRNIAGMMPCTVIRPGDMADVILDPQEHPDWHGERTKLIYAWPTAEKLWEEYAELRSSGLRRGCTTTAREFYRAHRAAMDAGAKVAWPERFPVDCISALQHAMNLKLRDEPMFWAEYQNEPMVARESVEMLTPEQIADKLNNRPLLAIPTACTRLEMFTDVQAKALYYAIVAFEPNFTGYVVDYGTYPDQKLHYFSYRQVRRTLQTSHRGKGEEAAIYAGLEELTSQKLGANWKRDDGAPMRISTCLIDAGYQKDVIELFCRQSRHAGIVWPSRGLPVSAKSAPISERARKKGEEIGEEWKVTGRQGQHSVRLIYFDANYWKSFVHARLADAMGASGCLSFWGKTPARHRMIAEHLTAETPKRTPAGGREIDEWKLLPGRDNHLLDCLVGCFVAASRSGCKLLGDVVPHRARSKVRRKLGQFGR